MIIVVLWRQKVQLYEKESFVHYSTEIQCTSLRFSNDYNYRLLTDLAIAHCQMITSTSEVQHSLKVSRRLIICFYQISPTKQPSVILLICI